ncbi:MAG: hydroxyacid dehydrogenase [Bdellovibrionales bacterium]|nr:hydroxyacid dehydrogenase [Bdellovibrionales bacterium]
MTGLLKNSQCVLVADRFTLEAIEFIRSQISGDVIQTENLPTRELLNKATALLIRSRTKINKELIEAAPNLKVIITATSGFDHIDFELTRKKNITVMFTPDANFESAAEHTLLLMLGVLRRLNESARLLREGSWKDELKSGFELKCKTVGIIGLGRVGSRVAELLQAFGAHVIAFDPYQDDKVFEKLGLERFGLSEVFAQAEILTLHVPLNEETRRYIRAETLELAHDGLIFINTSRGRVVDEGALIAALESGQIIGAGLDVFENEPLARDSRLRKLPNVLLTPHIGAHTEEAYIKASMLAAQKLITFINTGEISDNLPLQ